MVESRVGCRNPGRQARPAVEPCNRRPRLPSPYPPAHFNLFLASCPALPLAAARVTRGVRVRCSSTPAARAVKAGTELRSCGEHASSCSEENPAEKQLRVQQYPRRRLRRPLRLPLASAPSPRQPHHFVVGRARQPRIYVGVRLLICLTRTQPSSESNARGALLHFAWERASPAERWKLGGPIQKRPASFQARDCIAPFFQPLRRCEKRCNSDVR